jgi:uncharacterized membrane protein
MIIGCKTNSDKEPPAESSHLDTTLKVDTLKQVITDFAGLFAGTIPCADCKGIRQTMLFAGDSFHLEEIYLGKQQAPVIRDGRFMRQNQLLQLNINDSLFREYEIDTGSIVQLYLQGNRITGELEDKYRLSEKRIGADNKAWMKKKASGIDFLCIGNEPFWSLEIDSAKTINFLLASDMRTVKLPYIKPVEEDGKLQYNIQSDSVRMSILIENTFCSDGMSDNWYEYAVQVNYNDTLYKGCGVKLR